MDNPNNRDTILFVDDEQIVLNVGTMMIKKLGYKVLQATGGKEASRVFNENRDIICLVLLDINMPDENGSTTCRRIGKIDPAVKIIHTSGLGMNNADQILDCGCEGFLAKPFNLEELKKKIKECLESTDKQAITAS